jgi:hypothetical protein
VTFKDPFGATTTNLKLIARRYLYSRKGFLDIFGAFPWDLAPFTLYVLYGDENLNMDPFGYRTVSPYLVVWAYVRFLKFFTLSRIARYFMRGLMATGSVNNVNLAVQRMIYNLVMVLILGHVSSCLFWHVATMEGCRDSYIVQWYQAPLTEQCECSGSWGT